MSSDKGASAPVIHTESNVVDVAEQAENLALSAMDSMMDSVPDEAQAIEHLCDAVLILARLLRESSNGR